MSNAKKAKQPSLRDLARNAKPRLEHYYIPLIDYDDAMAVWTRLSEAKASLRNTRVFSDENLRAAAQAEVDQVQAEFDECFRKISFRGLSANDIDTLSNEHPDPAEGEEPEGHVPFLYHLAAASCVNGEDMTAEDWQDLCENVWSGPEAAAFRNAVMNANSREFTHGIPKG